MSMREEANKVPLLEAFAVCVASAAVTVTAPIWVPAVIIQKLLEKDEEKKQA